MNTKPPVTIVGCGVIGLSCGLICLEQGWATAIIARDLPPHTVSNRAGAVWFPFKAGPQELVGKWSAVAYRVLASLAQDPASGVHMTTLFDLHGQAITESPWWAGSLPGNCLRQAGPEELPPGYAAGFALRVPIIEPDKYLNFLMDRFRALGGVIGQQELHSLDELDQPVIINCTGLGARQLVQDTEVYPISGHIALAQPRQPVRCFLDEHGKNALAYVFPRSDACVLGGTAVEHDWNEEPDPNTIRSIIARCQEIEPGLAEAQIIRTYVGLRPGRRSIRFEKESSGQGRFIVHNYGHGGSGYTVSWGCARELAKVLSGS